MAKEVSVIFLDRDGTLTDDAQYPSDYRKVKLLAGVGEALRLLRDKGFPLCIVSNQSGVAKGWMTEEQRLQVHERFHELIEAESVEIFQYAYCLHHPDTNCGCRKPAIGLVPKSCEGRPINWSKSYVVGDRTDDILMGKKIGAQSVLVLTGRGQESLEKLEKGSYQIFDTLLDFAKTI